MPPTLGQLEQRREEIAAIAQRYGASNLRLFGSVARGTPHEGSDIDIMIDLERGRTLFDISALGRELGELLGCKVDVVLARGVKPRYREHVFAEAVPL